MTMPRNVTIARRDWTVSSTLEHVRMVMVYINEITGGPRTSLCAKKASHLLYIS
jgi:hypothetical protein